MATVNPTAPAEAQSITSALARVRIRRRWDAAAAEQLCERVAALEAQNEALRRAAAAPESPAASALARAALSHSRRRDRWMRHARERRAVPFLADEVARCVRCARDENRALLRALRSLAAL